MAQNEEPSVQALEREAMGAEATHHRSSKGPMHGSSRYPMNG